MQTIKLILTRTPIIYLVIFAIAFLLIDQKTVDQGNTVRVLNSLTPESYDFLTNLPGTKLEDKAQLQSYIEYYQKITEHLPDMADAHGLLGYCYYYNGDLDLAVEALEKAVSINPYFFWFHYNLAVIYSQQGKLQLAGESLTTALKLNPKAGLVFMRTTRLYQHILNQYKISDDEIKDQLEAGYLNAYKLLVLTYQRVNNYKAIIQVSNVAINAHKKELAFFYFYAGFSHYYLKDYKKAVYYLQESLKINPKVVEAFELLGLSAKILGNQNASKNALKQALLLKKSNTDENYKNITFYPRMY